MTATKRLYLLPEGSMADLSGQFDAPLRSITSEDLARIAALEAEPQTLFAHGEIKTGYSYAPIKEGVPDIPGRPTVTVEQGGGPKQNWAEVFCGACSWIVDICKGIALAALVVLVVTCAVAAIWVFGRF